MTFQGRLLCLLTCCISLLVFASGASAQYSGFCSDTCMAWDSCDTPCTECAEEGYDSCYRTRSTTCGEAGICGGCGVSNRWTETQNYKYLQDNGATHCLGREYWYGYVNWSQYLRYLTEARHVTFETTTCYNTGDTTREVSSYSDYGECYEFYDGTCGPYQLQEWGDVHGRECYF
jgi:hypothetical protein